MYPTTIMVLLASGFTLLPGGLLLALSRRTDQQPSSERAAYRLLHGLLIAIAVLMVVMYALAHQRLIMFIDDGFVLGTPLLAALVAITCLHLFRTAALHNRRTGLILLGYLAVIALINVWHAQSAEPYSLDTGLSVMLLIMSGGLTIAVVWQMVRGRGLWLVLGTLIALLCIENVVYNGTFLAWPHSVSWLLGVVSTFLVPVVLVALAGRVAAYLADPPHPINWRRAGAGMIAVAVLLVLLAIHIVELTLVDGMGDDGTLFPPMIFGLSVIAMALVLIWTLRRRRVTTALAYLAITLAAVYGYLTLTYSFSSPPETVTSARAAQVDQAIQQYYADTGQYPADLYSLVPRYLLTIPNPVLDWDQVWCYQGGSSFYRLGYLYRPAGQTIEATTTFLQGSAGNLPAGPWMCDTLLADYFERVGFTPSSAD